MKELKYFSLRVLTNYQSSGLSKCNWNAMNHIKQDLGDTGSIKCNDSGSYKFAQLIFKGGI